MILIGSSAGAISGLNLRNMPSRASKILKDFARPEPLRQEPRTAPEQPMQSRTDAENRAEIHCNSFQAVVSFKLTTTGREMY
jgi:hypothetical protein